MASEKTRFFLLLKAQLNTMCRKNLGLEVIGFCHLVGLYGISKDCFDLHVCDVCSSLYVAS